MVDVSKTNKEIITGIPDAREAVFKVNKLVITGQFDGRLSTTKTNRQAIIGIKDSEEAVFKTNRLLIFGPYEFATSKVNKNVIVAQYPDNKALAFKLNMAVIIAPVANTKRRTLIVMG